MLNRLLLIASMSLTLAACSQRGVPPTPPDSPLSASSVQAAGPEATAEKALMALKAKDMDALARLAHPEQGIRFTPYSHVDLDKDIVLLPEEIRIAFDDETVLDFGFFDGSGEPMELTFKAYFDRFVWGKDFSKASHVSWDTPVMRGNSIDNAAEMYPDARIVEYHIPGDQERYGGMDWQSLRLVLEQVDGEWKVVGIIHDQWTI